MINYYTGMYSLLFSRVVIIINLSFFIFPFLILSFKEKYKYYFKYIGLLQFSVIAFGLGAIVCTLDLLLRPETEFSAFMTSIKVIPNYIYWCVILLFF